MVINTRSISRQCTFNTVSSPSILALFPYVNPHIWKFICFISIFLFGVPFRFAYLSFLQLGLLEFGAILHTFIPGISRDSLLLFGKKNYLNINTFAGFTEYILFTLQIRLHSRFQLKYRLKGTVQRELRWVKIGINRTARINCIAGKCHFPCPKGHHHESIINVLGGCTAPT
jgi:hypothetical protein